MTVAVPAATRTLQVLRTLAASPQPLTADALSRRLSIPRSSIFQLLRVMEAEGFLTHFPEEERWGLGLSAFEIGAAYLRHEPLEGLARPVLHRLISEVDRSVQAVAHLGVLHGNETLYLLTESTRTKLAIAAEVGVRLPASLTASGRSILSVLDDAQVRALFPTAAQFVDRTGSGPLTPSALRRILTDERAQGWAEEDGFIAEGYSSVAACARDRSDRPIASVGLTFRTDRVDEATRTNLVRAVRRCADELSKRLGAP
jgi:DNA-binding IclR family transcriptional regulator